jgi:hypothetical protein
MNIEAYKMQNGNFIPVPDLSSEINDIDRKVYWMAIGKERDDDNASIAVYENIHGTSGIPKYKIEIWSMTETLQGIFLADNILELNEVLGKLEPLQRFIQDTEMVDGALMH